MVQERAPVNTNPEKTVLFLSGFVQLLFQSGCLYFLCLHPRLIQPFPSPQYNKHMFVHISQSSPSYSDPLLECVDIRQIYDKFPEKKGGLKELFAKGPQNAFYLIKFWVSRQILLSVLVFFLEFSE